MCNEYLEIRWKTGHFASLISPSKIILYIKHSTQCFITRWITSKFVKNTPLRVVFSTLFSAFQLVMKHCVSCLIYYFGPQYIAETLIYRRGISVTGKLTNLGFPRCETNSKLDFRGKRQAFDGKKPNWNALWRNISRDITGRKQTRLRSETNWKLLLYLDFRSYFEAASPNCFKVFCKILLQSIFLARIINKNKNHQRTRRYLQLIPKQGHPNAALKHSWASRILYFALRRSEKIPLWNRKLVYAHNFAILGFESTFTLTIIMTGLS